MRLKFTICMLFSMGLFLLSSCGDDDKEDKYAENILSMEAQLVSFSLSNSDIDSVVFSINQKIDAEGTGLIFNRDSIAYGKTLDNVVKLEFSPAVTQAKFGIKGDTVTFTSGDSIDIAQYLTAGSQFEVTSYDGLVKKAYNLQVNIRQVDPDSVHYMHYSSLSALTSAARTKAVQVEGATYLYIDNGSSISLKMSEDMSDWTDVVMQPLPAGLDMSTINVGSVSVLSYSSDGKLYRCNPAQMGEAWSEVAVGYPVLSVLGYMNESDIQEKGYSIIIEKDGSATFAFMRETDWGLELGNTVSDNFPLSDFSTFGYRAMNVERLSLVGGLDKSGEILKTVWSTQNGLYWALIASSSSQAGIPALHGANSFIYDGEFFLMNGKRGDGSGLNRIVYSSTDGGVTWSAMDDKAQFPVDYTARYGASLVMNEDETYFYIVGGRDESDSPLDDIWRGNKNELIVEN